MQTSDRIGRRLKLRDLHVFMTAAQAGGMSKAAKTLHMTQSAVSRSISDLEHAMGVRLLDRRPQGIEPTAYGKAMFDGGIAVFDDLQRTVKHIEFLSDPTAGHVIVGGSAMTSAGFLPAVIARLHGQHPHLSLQLTPAQTPAQQLLDLRERRVDLIVSRVPAHLDEDIEAEILFPDGMVVIAGKNSKWAQKRKIEFAELTNELWCLPPLDSPVGDLIADAFRANGVKFPPRGSAIGAMQLFATLVVGEPFIGIYPESMLRFAANLPPLKILPVSLPSQPRPVGIMTLKHRTLNPTTQLFIECARDVAKPMAQKG